MFVKILNYVLMPWKSNVVIFSSRAVLFCFSSSWERHTRLAYLRSRRFFYYWNTAVDVIWIRTEWWKSRPKSQANFWNSFDIQADCWTVPWVPEPSKIKIKIKLNWTEIEEIPLPQPPLIFSYSLGDSGTQGSWIVILFDLTGKCWLDFVWTEMGFSLWNSICTCPWCPFVSFALWLCLWSLERGMAEWSLNSAQDHIDMF